jgi:hypothetical protein
MSETAATIVWLALAGYAAPGLLLACWLVLGGLRRIDAVAAAAPWPLRLLFLPGLAALWPILLMRLAGRRPPEDRP